MIVLRKALISPKGLPLRQPQQPSQRAFLSIDSLSGVVRCWLIGGVETGDGERLRRVQEEEEPADVFELRMVHWHEHGNDSVVVHYTRGQERIMYSGQGSGRNQGYGESLSLGPGGSLSRGHERKSDTLTPRATNSGHRTPPLHLLFSKALKESTSSAQQSTSLHLLQHSTLPALRDDDGSVVDFKWPGKLEPVRAHCSLKMMPGWRDSRLVSKRCLEFSHPVTGKLFVRINSITAVYVVDGSATVVMIEGNGQWMQNDREACPLWNRIALEFVSAQADDDDEFWGLVKGLREAFEIINRPWLTLVGLNGGEARGSARGNAIANANTPQSLQSLTSQGIEFSKISTSPSSSPSKLTPLLTDLFQAKPFSSLPLHTSYTAYSLLCQSRGMEVAGVLEFIKAGRGGGWCLKDERGGVVKGDLQLQDDSVIGKGWYWNHVQLKGVV